MTEPAVVHSSPDETYITAVQNAPEGSTEALEPRTLFVVGPTDYMERSAEGESLVLEDVKQDSDEIGDANSLDDEGMDQAMRDSFWERVQVLVKFDETVEEDVLESQEMFSMAPVPNAKTNQ